MSTEEYEVEAHPTSALSLMQAQDEWRAQMSGEFEASASTSPALTAKRRAQAEAIVKARMADEYEAAIAAEMKALEEGKEDA